MKGEKLSFLIVAVLIIIQYANSLTLDYALDDRLVIFNNEYTLKGFDGVGEVFTRDGFTGYFTEQKNLVAGGRYRPLSQLTFILEYEFFGKDIKNLINRKDSSDNEKIFT